MIRIHNSLTGDKQDLVPIEPGHVRMYSCGVTVYDYFHVGMPECSWSSTWSAATCGIAGCA